MKLRLLHEALAQVRIAHFDPDEHDWAAADQADEIAQRSGIRIGRNKELRFIALANDQVVGAVWVALEQDRDNGATIYDFDVAVDPTMRAQGLASAGVGPKLIDAALADYRNEAAMGDGHTYIRVWVVNPKLARWLENHRDFSPESHRGWSPDAPHMTYGI